MREDIEKSMDPQHQFEERHVYKFPEQDLEETKIMPPIKGTKETKVEEIATFDEEEKPKKKKKNKKKWIMIGGITTGFLVIFLMTFLFFIKPMLTKVKDVKIPDVKGMTIAQADAALHKEGLIVEKKVEEKFSDSVEAGKVIQTLPETNRTVKEGTTVTLIVSKGKDGFELESYIGEKFEIIKKTLEDRGIVVISEIQEITEETDDLKDGVVVEQSLEKGTFIETGKSITLIYTKLVDGYPDFTDGSWNIDSIKEFCDDHNIYLTVKEQEDGTKPEGTILSQSREAKSKIEKNAPLTIYVAKKPTIVEKPDKPDEDKENNDKEDNKDENQEETKPE